MLNDFPIGIYFRVSTNLSNEEFLKKLDFYKSLKEYGLCGLQINVEHPDVANQKLTPDFVATEFKKRGLYGIIHGPAAKSNIDISCQFDEAATLRLTPPSLALDVEANSAMTLNSNGPHSDLETKAYSEIKKEWETRNAMGISYAIQFLDALNRQGILGNETVTLHPGFDYQYENEHIQKGAEQNIGLYMQIAEFLNKYDFLEKIDIENIPGFCGRKLNESEVLAQLKGDKPAIWGIGAHLLELHDLLNTIDFITGTMPNFTLDVTHALVYHNQIQHFPKTDNVEYLFKNMLWLYSFLRPKKIHLSGFTKKVVDEHPGLLAGTVSQRREYFEAVQRVNICLFKLSEDEKKEFNLPKFVIEYDPIAKADAIEQILAVYDGLGFTYPYMQNLEESNLNIRRLFDKPIKNKKQRKRH